MALLQSLRGCPTLNTETITPTLCNLTPPPLERQGGREGKSIHCLGPLLLRALVFAASAGFDQAALVARRFRLTSDLASSHDSAQLLRIQKRLHKPHLPTGSYILIHVTHYTAAETPLVSMTLYVCGQYQWRPCCCLHCCVDDPPT